MTDPNFYIETPRLYISYFQPALDSHCDFLVKLYNTPEFIAAEGLTAITSREAARERLSTRIVDQHERNGYGTYLVSLKPQSRPADPEEEGTPELPSANANATETFQEKLARCKLIGSVSLTLLHSDTAYTIPDLGFAMLSEEMRKGYAKEASIALLEYAKREKGVDVVQGLFYPHNEGSRGVFRSLGFEDRGIRKLSPSAKGMDAVWITPGAAEDLSVYNIKYY